MSLDGKEAGKWKPQGAEVGPSMSAGERPGEGRRILEDPRAGGHGPPGHPTWPLTLEAGQVGILGFGFQQVRQPCVAVPEPTAL